MRDLTAGSTEMISVNSAHEDATRDGNDDDVGAGPVSADGLGDPDGDAGGQPLRG